MSPVQELKGAGYTATSADGRTFHLRMSPHQVFPVGSFVSLTDDQGLIRLAQVETHQLLPDGQMQVVGSVLGTLAGKALDKNTLPVFVSATVAEAHAEMITSLNMGLGATLDIGSLAAGSDLPARLTPQRLNRRLLVRPMRVRQDVRARCPPGGGLAAHRVTRDHLRSHWRFRTLGRCPRGRRTATRRRTATAGDSGSSAAKPAG